MKALKSEQAITLTADEAAFVRQALLAAAGIFAQAERAGGPGLRALREAALDVVADGRPLGQVHSHVNLAVDYIDFATPARRTR